MASMAKAIKNWEKADMKISCSWTILLHFLLLVRYLNEHSMGGLNLFIRLLLKKIWMIKEEN